MTRRPLSRRARIALAALAASAFVAAGAKAQDLEPREYTNVPVGLNFFAVAYGYSDGGVSTDASLPLDDAEIEVSSTTFAYVRALDVGGRSGKVDLVLSCAWLDGSARFQGQPRQRKVRGCGDPVLRLSVNLYGAPSLSLKEFARYEQDLIVGASVRVSAPLGQYDSDKLVNLGTNRWSLKPQLGVSKAWGRWTTELSAAVALYEDNDDFLAGRRREQDPLYSLQAHVICAFGRGIWAAASVTWYRGGETTIDGLERDDWQENTRVGASLSLPLGRRHSVKLFATKGVHTRTGTDFDTFGIAWQVRWGAGI